VGEKQKKNQEKKSRKIKNRLGDSASELPGEEGVKEEIRGFTGCCVTPQE
jgi:hypothetical protein